MDGIFHPFAPPRMAAAAVRPIEWPQSFCGAALLQQQFAGLVENEQGKGAMQNTTALVALSLGQMTHLRVLFVY